MKKTSSGFTVVELLIVIVVIGILAAITIVAYNGIQNRAKGTKDRAIAQSYIKALQIWNAEEGVWPSYNSCIGPAASYPSNVCAVAPTWGTNAPYVPVFNQKLNTYRGKSEGELTSNTAGTPAGTMWYIENYFGEGKVTFYYSLSSTENCGLSNVMDASRNLTGALYTFRDSLGTHCNIRLN